MRLAVPLDVEGPAIAEPAGANLALLAGVYEDGVAVVYARGGLADDGSVFGGAYLYIPHDAIVPGPVQVPAVAVPLLKMSRLVATDGMVDAQNRAVGKATPPTEVAAGIVKRLKK